MAKKADEVTEQPKGDKPALWSPEDMGRLDQAITEIAGIVTDLQQRFETIEHRAIAIETQFSKIDIGEGLLPAEVAQGVKPDQVYLAALQAGLIAAFMSNPTGMLNPVGLKSQIQRVHNVAEAMLNESIRRTQLGRRKVG